MVKETHFKVVYLL